MHAHRLFASAVCLAALSTFSGALYAVDSAESEPATMRLASDDRAFMKQAASAGAYQLAMSKLAQRRTTSTDVRKLATKVARDHSVTNAQLQKLAVNKSYTLPATMTSAQQKSLASLSAEGNQDFDRDYVQKVGIDNVKGDIKSFSSAARSSKDSNLKAWAAKTLPLLEDHLATAQSIKTAVN